jgi:hypothetical protein
MPFAALDRPDIDIQALFDDHTTPVQSEKELGSTGPSSVEVHVGHDRKGIDVAPLFASDGSFEFFLVDIYRLQRLTIEDLPARIQTKREARLGKIPILEGDTAKAFIIL